jgi:hypothetical protein
VCQQRVSVLEIATRIFRAEGVDVGATIENTNEIHDQVLGTQLLSKQRSWRPRFFIDARPDRTVAWHRSHSTSDAA